MITLKGYKICFGQIIAATRKYLFLNVRDVYKKSILKYRKIKTHIYIYGY